MEATDSSARITGHTCFGLDILPAIVARKTGQLEIVADSIGMEEVLPRITTAKLEGKCILMEFKFGLLTMAFHCGACDSNSRNCLDLYRTDARSTSNSNS